ncbi:DinB family protein [Seonamhaeicola maritimus]|uniref:DinB family protein n=1 Tax=Seonamhaeicola maritimus TaxID=2591822 RepID=UPI0024950265|nr:DinB family protein [Seonamhaeicola maritimus]
MLTETLIALFKRDLNKLKAEIELYKSESNLWLLEKGINNTAGNLALHLVGNLNHFIGAVLGNTGYVRQRDLEFSLKDVPRIEILKQINETIEVVEKTLKDFQIEALEKNYPIEVFGKPMTTEYFLVHLTTHLSYHLGQINYHRRLLDL